ncbi:PepSY-associated TM helix domain-containing protein [Bradyrhizobium liaoningense]|uniref:PepSY-associated TM helix domain-containing protein n=1 Tax=Bradyrhizobium liaoningense TaxID=43992 RepID=UPI001BAB193B|nr:PepSY domain-containing protein [Bradyrhizobium liaoningense]MBR0709845.1 PepSY domain-containing protein [Bradyrhizobium liaoningense]
MTATRLRWWSWIHKWSSLICTIFALLLCLTGLPLIFHEELGPSPAIDEVADSGSRASVDTMIAQALAGRPGEVVPYLFYDREKPIVKIPTAASMTSAPDTFFYKVFDVRTGKALSADQPNEGFIYVMLRLHADLFAGIKGTLFLGGMGLLLAVSIVSGMVLYGPFARRLRFGEIRKRHSNRLRWLDLHNLLGIITLAWFGIVTLTGVINTLAAPIELMWQSNQLIEMAAQNSGQAQDDRRAPVDLVLARVRAAVPGMTVTTLAFPGSPFSTPTHYAAFLTGDTPLTSRILKPAIIDAASGEVVAVRDMPWYATALFVSQPLHFGDYGGLPLKIIWAILDIVTMIILISGLYLWLAKWRSGRAVVDAVGAVPAEPAR